MAIPKINYRSKVNERAKNELRRIKGDLPNAIEAVDQYGKIDLYELGVDWNNCVLVNTKGNGIRFTLDERKLDKNTLKGLVGIQKEKLLTGFFPYANITLYDKNRLVGKSGLTRGEIINSVGEAVNIASKLEIISDEILPPGEITLPVINGKGRHGGERREYEDYRAMVAELLFRGRGIIAARKNEQFGDYMVVETNQDFYIAYNKNYGEAPYIVKDLDILKLDKQSIRQGDFFVKRLRRDQRGNWKSRLREYC